MDLREWTGRHIDHLARHRGDLLSKQQKADTFLCEYKDKGQVAWIAEDKLGPGLLPRLAQGKVFLVCLNTRANVVFLADNWAKFSANPNLKVTFVCPEQNLYWSLLPSVHAKISDPSTLKQGLLSLHESVPDPSVP